MSNLSDMMLAAYALACFGLFLYLLYWCLQRFGKFAPSLRVRRIIQIFCAVLLLSPLVVQYHMSEHTLFYLGVAIGVTGLLILWIRRTGI